MLDKYAKTIALKSKVEQGSHGGFIDNPREVAEDLLALKVPGWTVSDAAGFKTTGKIRRPATQQEVNDGKAIFDEKKL